MDHNLTLKHVNSLHPLKIVFAFLLSLLSVYLLFSGTLFGLILLGAAFKLALQEGIEISLEGKKYRKLYSIFGISIGSWKVLPDIDYISVFQTKKKSRARVIAAQADLGFEIYRLNLFYETNKHIVAFEADDREDAFAKAKHIALVLDIPVHDATKSAN